MSGVSAAGSVAAELRVVPLGVGLVLDLTTFSLRHALPSPTSAEGFPSLFGGSQVLWPGQTPLQRTCPPFGSAPSRTALDQIERSQRSPASRACCFSTCSGSRTTQGRVPTRDLTRTPVLPSPSPDEVGTLIQFFSKLHSPARRCLCLRFKRRLATPSARLEVKVVRYSFLVGLFHS